MAGRAALAVYNAIIARLKTIQGAPTYWTNLENHVYRPLWLPEENKAAPPYACVPLFDPDIAFDSDEGPMIRALWTQPIFFFVPDIATDEMDSNAADALMHVFDDFIKAMQADWKLAQTCENSTIKGAAWFAAETPDFRYGALRVDLEVRAYLPVENLGP